MKRVVFLTTLSVLLVSRPARAADPGKTGAAILFALPFLAAGAVYTSRSSWAAPGWAISELVQSAIYLSVAAGQATDDLPGLGRSVWVWGTLGFAMLVHGTLSVVLYRLPGTRVALQVGPGSLAMSARW